MEYIVQEIHHSCIEEDGAFFIDDEDEDEEGKSWSAFRFLRFSFAIFLDDATLPPPWINDDDDEDDDEVEVEIDDAIGSVVHTHNLLSCADVMMMVSPIFTLSRIRRWWPWRRR